VGWLVLSVVLGVLVWGLLSGRLPLDWRRALSWWLDVEGDARPSAPLPPPPEDPAPAPGLLARFNALFSRLGERSGQGRGEVAAPVPVGEAGGEGLASWSAVRGEASPPLMPESMTNAALPAMVPPIEPEPEPEPEPDHFPVMSEPAAAAPLPDVPVIGLQDVTDNLHKRRYRPQPAAVERELPVLDGKAIRANMLGRVRSPVRIDEPETELPVIGPAEVEQNLQLLGPRHRERAEPDAPQPEPLPMIDTDEVRANLRQIHGARLKPRSEPDGEMIREPAAPPVRQPVASAPSVPMATSNTMPASPLLRSQRSGEVPPRFVAVPPASTVLPAAAAPLIVAPDAPAAAPRQVPPPVQVMPSMARPTPRTAPPPLSALASVPEVRAQAVPAVPRPAVVEPGPDMPGQTVFVAAQPSAAPAAGPGPEAPEVPDPVSPPVLTAESSALVWHSIEERLPQAPAVAESMPAAPPAAPWPVLPTPATPAKAVGEEAPSPWASTGAAATPSAAVESTIALHLWDDSSLPGLDLLRPADPFRQVCSDESLIERGIVIEEKLAEFKVKVRVVDACAGPVITRFEVEPAVGVRGSQVVNLVKDLARALGLASIRVVETIPGKTCMGLELPNPVRQMIRLSEIFSAPVFVDSGTRLTLALGKDITGEPVVMDLAKAPHLLVAGTTGSGKSVGVNAMILSLLYRFTPDKVRFIMIDPKMLELSVYNDIPHLLAPVVTDMKLAANALNWCVGEMEKRYRLMSALGVRNLAGYNDKVREAAAAGEKLTNPFSLTPETPEPLEVLPSIVVVVDEFADLMMVAGKKIEELIARLAQKARAAGIHLILATQRPSVDVITGLIKANIPTRIAFQVSSKVDSRTILDQMGAEALLGQGDMLFLPPGSGYPQRIHGAFVTDDEVHAVVETLKSFGEPDYVDGLLTGEAELEEGAATERNAGAESDPLYDEAVSIVMRTRKASISSVQRHLRIGYNRAARLIEEMEAAGLVSSMESNGNRSVLVPSRPDQGA